MSIKVKFSLIISLLILPILLFTACNNNDLGSVCPGHYVEVDSYKAFVIEFSDSASTVPHQAELNVKEAVEKVDPTIPQTATLTINGQTIEGTYSHSEKSFPDNFYRHVYYGNRKTHKFYLDDSGRLLFFSWPGLVDGAKGGKELTEEECLAIAKDFILNNFSENIDLSDYTVEENGKPYYSRYQFVFRKYVNDCATTDTAVVHVDKSGAVYAYSSSMFDRIPVDQVAINREAAVKAMKVKLDTIYQDVKGNYTTTNYEEPEFYFTLLDDGSPAIYCTVTVRFEHSSGLSYGEMLGLIIK